MKTGKGRLESKPDRKPAARALPAEQWSQIDRGAGALIPRTVISFTPPLNAQKVTLFKSLTVAELKTLVGGTNVNN